MVFAGVAVAKPRRDVSKILLMKNRMFTVCALAIGLLLSVADVATARSVPVPDAGTSGVLLGIALAGVIVMRNFFSGRK